MTKPSGKRFYNDLPPPTYRHILAKRRRCGIDSGHEYCLGLSSEVLSLDLALVERRAAEADALRRALKSTHAWP